MSGDREVSRITHRLLPVLNSILTCVVLSSLAWAGDWTGQRTLSRPDGGLGDIMPTIGIDLSGNPMVVWNNCHESTDLACVRWVGNRWSDEAPAGPANPGGEDRPAPSLACDNVGSACLAWTRLRGDNRMLGSSSFWNGTDWGAEVQIALPQDSCDSDYSPDMAWGGGEFWTVWGRGPTIGQPDRVFASRWDSASESWLPEMRISPPDGDRHWFSHLAVDSQGLPHVVWVDLQRYAICYSHYNGREWVGPLFINDTSQVKAPSRAAPRIAIDRQGGLHVCFTGVASGAGSRDVFYSKNTGEGWTPAIKVSRDGIYDEWYSDIAVSDSDNIWVVWDRQGEGSDQFRIHCSHYKSGSGWSPEERLDNDSAYNDRNARVALDPDGEPTVAWNGNSRGPGDYSDVYANRRLRAGTAVEGIEPVKRVSHLTARELPTGCVRFSYVNSRPGPALIDVLDGLGRSISRIAQGDQAAGKHVVEWNGADSRGRRVPSGIYFCRLRTNGIEEVCRFTRIVR